MAPASSSSVSAEDSDFEIITVNITEASIGETSSKTRHVTLTTRTAAAADDDVVVSVTFNDDDIFVDKSDDEFLSKSFIFTTPGILAGQ